MLRFVRVRRVQLRGLSLAADGLASHCVQTESWIDLDLQDQSVSLERCAFSDALQSLVNIRDISIDPPPGGSLRAVVRQCHFFVFDPRSLLLGGSFAGQRVGLSLEAAYASRLLVVGSHFTGTARRALRAAGGLVQVLGCRFDIAAALDELSPQTADVELAQRAEAEGAPFASLFATGCVSTSPSFLRVNRPLDTPGPPSRAPQVELSAVVHRPILRGLASTPVAPAVTWVGLVEGATMMDGRLAMHGCLLERAPEATGPLVQLPRVLVHTNPSKVYNVGTFREDDGALALGAVLPRDEADVRSLGSNGPRAGPAPLQVAALLRHATVGPWLNRLLG